MRFPWWAAEALACLAALAAGLAAAHFIMHYLFGDWWPW